MLENSRLMPLVNLFLDTAIVLNSLPDTPALPKLLSPQLRDPAIEQE